ncbi:MAG: integration host factor subunit alpha [Oligoflexia bacterium]|nr:integration host factor subunit alpha [Oligoflexia bacterium]MBF0365940.1 integration host factor subunit alpha [Oligoflexia bacterium]
MTKSDIVNRVCKEMALSKKEANDLIETIFKVIKDTLSNGEKVKISGFGNFCIRDKGTRVGRNPQTGESMEITARRVLTFKPSQVLRDDVTSKYAHRINREGEENTSLPAKEGHSRALASFMGGDEIDDDESADDDVYEEEFDKN